MSITTLTPHCEREHNVLSDMFRSLASTEGSAMTAATVIAALTKSGLDPDDGRIRGTMDGLHAYPENKPLTDERFAELIAVDELALIHKALSGGLVIPDFSQFSAQVADLFETCRNERTGRVADYIPQLARVDAEMYGLGLCTVDGQRAALGDAEERYCVQSTCKPINYAAALDLLGRDEVHRHVGREPSGRSFNELTLNSSGLPHNPMINSGAIMCSSLIDRSASLADRFDRVMSVWRDLSGGTSAGFDNAVHLSEKETADRNFALAYFMRENDAFPPDTDVVRTLDFYFQCCSITVDVRQMSVVAATLANGGVCPVTNKRVFQADTVKDCLSLMYSCGMYDFSGEFAFSVGIPAKSGVSGALMLVIPGVCGIAVWSPRLDRHGNSVRGVAFAKLLVETFSFHAHANMVDDPTLIDPTATAITREVDASGYLCAAAAAGDLSEIRRLIASGADVGQADYDGRTALHLAASEGQEDAVRLLIKSGAPLAPVDRWGNTPFCDAKRANAEGIAALLQPTLTEEFAAAAS